MSGRDDGATYRFVVYSDGTYETFNVALEQRSGALSSGSAGIQENPGLQATGPCELPI